MMKKIQKFTTGLRNSLILTKEFGFKMGLLDFQSDVILRSRGYLGRKADYTKHEYVKHIIRNKYSDDIERCKNKFHSWKKSGIADNAPIWIFWWQGIEAAPEIVKLCINSIRINCGKHPVYILDKANFNQYISISDIIQNKMINGKISITHFSDILRMSILYEKGGIWIDSTVLLQGSIDKLNICRNSFFTIKHGLGEQYHVCKGLWSTFFLACTPRHPFLGGIKDILISYAEQEKVFICYLLIDCIMAVLYEDIPEVKTLIDTVPKTNEGVFKLESVLSSIYEKKVYDSLYSKIFVNKLSYRNTALKKVENKITNYGYICSIYSCD
ncbi:hypothetical protein H6A32_08465 [Drancourtella massiliensis]|uniref:Capsular biosynthesis protein n=1 Tax=Drancourtella massiliensis TaxID=1632013 RepID=A0ABS2EH26_9FIRM|nr:capsular polysaccharide synthesis protein [Drancourtella massiliensis]MBM6744339.1 hypothetical protein [Drancourtella massiliensis]